MADGLRNMQQRLEDIGGKCAIEGQRGSGTKVTIELSLGSEARNSGKP
jgi:signal transduction histidine kinase